MKNPIAWMTLILVVVFGLSSQSARSSLDQSGRNQFAMTERKLETLNSQSAPSLGTTRLESPEEIRNLLIRQQISEQMTRNPAMWMN